MAKYQILSWHGIPLQVRAGRGRERVSMTLPERFQAAVDSAAMEAKLVGSDEYLEGFRWSEAQERAGTAEEVVAAMAQELEAQHPKIEWRATAARLSRH